MYERILVPLDGSPFSEEVIPYAAGLAAIHGTELVLLRVVEKASEEESARDYIDSMASYHGTRGLSLVDTGDAARAILAEAGRQPSTLLAMTSRGRSGLMELVLGSVAQRVVRGAGGPVLVYRPTGTKGRSRAPVKLRSVILPLDGGALSEAMAGDAARFARWVDADLELVSAVEIAAAEKVGKAVGGEMPMIESSYIRSLARELTKQHGVQVDWEVLHGDPVDAITGHVGRRDDVILVAGKGHEDYQEVAGRRLPFSDREQVRRTLQACAQVRP